MIRQIEQNNHYQVNKTEQTSRMRQLLPTK